MKTIELYCGLTREETYAYLQKKAKELGEAVQASFNGNWVNSYMTEDQIYLTITGHTKAYIEEQERIEQAKRKQAQKAFQEKIPELCENVMKSVLEYGLIQEDKKEEFSDILPYRFNDIYQGEEIYNMIAINRILIDHQNDPGQAIELARKKFDEQGHSNRSAYITAMLVHNYCPVLGTEFFDQVFLGK